MPGPAAAGFVPVFALVAAGFAFGAAVDFAFDLVAMVNAPLVRWWRNSGSIAAQNG